MKSLILILAIAAGTFQQGWNEGYKRGYCSGDPFCIAPIPPIAPIPFIGFDTYQDGYDLGVIKGRKDKDSIEEQ